MSVQQRLTFLTTRRRQLMAGLFAGVALIATSAAAATGTVTLTVTPKPTGGAIWVNDQAIRCGNSSAGGNACSITVAKGSVAKAWMFNDTGYTYAGWVGACSGNGQNCNITMDSNKTLSANFGSTQTKNITLTAPQNGSIDWFGGSKCGSQCSRTVNVNSSATLTALPNLGYAVGSWSGACSGSGPTCVVTASNDVSASVSFKNVGTYTVTVSPKPSHGAVWVENQRCRCGDSGAGGNACSCQVTRGATTSAWQFNDSGYNYTGWTGACASSGKSQNCNIKMDGDKTVSAGFAK